MSTHETAFAIQGMFCARCAVAIERALTRLDGVVAARVNYATERATVVYDPRRVSGRTLVSAVRNEGFDVPIQRVTLQVYDLLYATSPGTVENALRRMDGVADVAVELGTERVTVDTFGKHASQPDLERALGRLGFHMRASAGSNRAWQFAIRTLLATSFALIIVVSAGEHAGWIPETSLLHVPFVVVVISFIALVGAGLPFYRSAYDAFLQGEFDASVLIALISSAFFFIGVPLALVAPTAWLTGIAFVVATTLTAGWFIARGFTALVLPRSQRARAVASRLASQIQLGVISNGTRR